MRATPAASVTRIVVSATAADLAATRRILRGRLRARGLGDATIEAVEQAATELLGAVFERAGAEPADLTISCYRLLVSVRVSSRRAVDLGDEPSGIRERLVSGVAFASGRRIHPDGTVDLWAEVARDR